MQAAVASLGRKSLLPEVSASRRLVQKLGAAEVAPAKPATAALEVLRARLRQIYATGRRDELTRRDRQNAPWILWNGDPGAATFPGLLDDIVAHAGQSPRTARNIIEAWLRDFRTDDRTIAAAGHAIDSILRRADDARLDLWRQARRDFDLFDAGAGPRRLATALVSGSKSVRDTLAHAGLDDPLRAAGGYMRATIRALLDVIPKAMRGKAAMVELERALDALVTPEGLRFGSGLRGEIGQALLRPWLDSGRVPDAKMRDAVREFLLKHLGDPRLRPPNWASVGEQGTSLVRSWLARASLKAFFNLISDHALDSQWRFREAFWTAYLDNGAISDAWLVLASQVHRTARSIRDLSGSYGLLEGGRISGDHTVLLLRIGNLVLCEWSHNGKLRAWPTDWKNAPQLYRARYTREDLTGKCLPFPPNALTGSRGAPDGSGLSHVGAPRGNWQGSASELIARKASVRLSSVNWMPK